MAVARYSSGGVVIPYILPVLWMTSYLRAVIPVAGRQMRGTTFRARRVTSQVATPAAESAVYECFVSSGVTIGWLLRLLTGAPLVVGGPRQFYFILNQRGGALT